MDKQPSVMVVEDDAATRRVLLMILRHRGLRLTEAANGADALAMARHEHPDVMLLDVRLPGDDGIAVCAAVKSNPETSRIKVVMLTAMDRRAEEPRASAAGADGYIAKPFDVTELLGELAALLGRPDIALKDYG